MPVFGPDRPRRSSRGTAGHQHQDRRIVDGHERDFRRRSPVPPFRRTHRRRDARNRNQELPPHGSRHRQPRQIDDGRPQLP